MKQVYTRRFFDIIIIILCLFSFFDGITSLFEELEYFNSYLIRIIITGVSLVAFISMMVEGVNGERYSRFFVLIVLIFPSVAILVRVLDDLLFYLAVRTYLLQAPLLYIKLIAGLILFYFSIQFSKQSASERTVDYAILGILAGAYMMMLTVIKVIESNVKKITHIGFGVEIVVAMLIVFVGYLLKNNRMKLRTFLICISLLVFAYAV